MAEKSRVLILCTGNSARSQMAEALINDRLGDRWEAVSAGTHPAQDVHPQALKALEEMGIQHSGHPKLVDQFRAEKFDLVITVCDEAAEECPLWLGSGKRVHHGFPDPAQSGRLEDFRTVRDRIVQEILPLLDEYEA